MRTGRLQVLLLTCAKLGTITRDTLGAASGWTSLEASKAIENAKHLEHIVGAAERVGNLKSYKLTATGQTRVEKYHATGLAAAVDRAPEPDEVLAGQALAKLAEAALGLNSSELALACDSSIEEVDAALALYVAMHQLVTCHVQAKVGGVMVHMHHYRISAGVAGGAAPKYDWTTQRDTTWDNREGAALARAEVSAEAKINANTAPPSRLRDEPPAWPDETGAAPTLLRLPVLDLPTRDLPKRDDLRSLGGALEFADGPAHAECAPEPTGFVCALFSDGALTIESGSHTILLPVEHTRMLLGYLDALDAHTVAGHA